MLNALDILLEQDDELVLFGASVPAPGVPVITSLSPNHGVIDTAVPISITGTGFLVELSGGDAELAISGTGVTLGSIVIVSDILITATATIDVGASLGPRSITVETDDGVSNIALFHVESDSVGGFGAGLGRTRWKKRKLLRRN